MWPPNRSATSRSTSWTLFGSWAGQQGANRCRRHPLDLENDTFGGRTRDERGERFDGTERIAWADTRTSQLVTVDHVVCHFDREVEDTEPQRFVCDCDRVSRDMDVEPDRGLLRGVDRQQCLPGGLQQLLAAHRPEPATKLVTPTQGGNVTGHGRSSRLIEDDRNHDP